jgi:hypothetical protein
MECAFNEILKRKDLSIQNQIASLQSKIISGEKIIENNVAYSTAQKTGHDLRMKSNEVK